VAALEVDAGEAAADVIGFFTAEERQRAGGEKVAPPYTGRLACWRCVGIHQGATQPLRCR